MENEKPANPTTVTAIPSSPYVPTPEITTKSSQNKKFAVGLIIFLLSVIALALIIAFLRQTSSPVSKDTSTNADKNLTDNWPIFTDETKNFTIKYPTTLKTSYTVSSYLNDSCTRFTNIPLGNPDSSEPVNLPQDGKTIEVCFVDEKLATNLTKFSDGQSTWEIINVKPVVINSYEGLSGKTKDDVTSPTLTDVSFVRRPTTRGYLVIRNEHGKNDIYLKILSTIKFLPEKTEYPKEFWEVLKKAYNSHLDCLAEGKTKSKCASLSSAFSMSGKPIEMLCPNQNISSSDISIYRGSQSTDLNGKVTAMASISIPPKSQDLKKKSRVSLTFINNQWKIDNIICETD